MTASGCHDLTHHCHVELTSVQLCCIDPGCAVVLLAKLERAWSAPCQAAPTPIATELLPLPLLCHIPVMRLQADTAMLGCCDETEQLRSMLRSKVGNIAYEGNVSICERKHITTLYVQFALKYSIHHRLPQTLPHAL